jgi:hypothetical protein
MTCELEAIMSLFSKVVRAPLRAGELEPNISVATLVCLPDVVRSYEDTSRLLAALKKHAKRLSGTSCVLGRSGSDQTNVLHGRAEQRPAERSATAQPA